MYLLIAVVTYLYSIKYRFFKRYFLVDIIDYKGEIIQMEKKLLETWEELNNHLLFFIRKRIKNKEDAEDILQDVYIKLHKNIDSLNDEKK